MPDTLFASWLSVHEWAEYPTWVKAGAALDAAGQPRAELFPRQSRETLSYYLAMPATNGCIEIQPLIDESANPPRRGDLRTGVATSQLVFLAEVTGRAAGFERSDPGTLLRLRPTEVFRSEDGPALAEYFLFVPKGTVQAGAKTLCKREPSYAELPSLGDDVLVFVQRDWIDTSKEPYLRSYGDGGAMITLHDDTVSAPALYAADTESLATRRAVIDHVRALAALSGEAEARGSLVTNHSTIQTLDWISQRLLEGERKALEDLDPVWYPILKQARRNLLYRASKGGEPSTAPPDLGREKLLVLASNSGTVVLGRIVSIEQGVSLLPLEPARLVTIQVTENLRSDDDRATPKLIQAIVPGGVAIADGSQITAEEAIPLPVLDTDDQVLLLGWEASSPEAVIATRLLRVRRGSVELPGEARGAVSLESIRAAVAPEGGEEP